MIYVILKKDFIRPDLYVLITMSMCKNKTQFYHNHVSISVFLLKDSHDYAKLLDEVYWWAAAAIMDDEPIR